MQTGGVLLGLWLAGMGAAETVRLPATADIWVSDATPEEANTSSGRCPRLKLKTIQELSAIRFDASAARGREVLRARLLLRLAREDLLRYIRVSTVNQDWVEGRGEEPYGPPDGATFRLADAGTQRPWAWPGSSMADVIMTSGHSLATWAACERLADGWIAVALTPELVTSLAVGDTDGLAVMDGGNPTYFNNFVYSVQQAGSEPYIEAELGRALADPPAKPQVTAEPAAERAHLETGAISVAVAPSADTFCWRLALDGEPVERWRVPHPGETGSARFVLEDLPPGRAFRLGVTAVSAGGQASAPAEVQVTSSAALALPPDLGTLEPPTQGVAPAEQAGRMRVWACPGLVKLSPETGEVMCGDLGPGDPRRANAAWDGQRIRLFGARGETVSCQLCIENLGPDPLTGLSVQPEALTGPGGATLAPSALELFLNWCARNADGSMQPAYCVPLAPGQTIAIPDPRRGLPEQRNQSLYVDLYVPKDAAPGDYTGTLVVRAEGVEPTTLPVALRVLDFVVPDRLSFWPELNAYSVPDDAQRYYLLAHEHRCVLNCWRWEPEVRGSGRDIEVLWGNYDRDVGPLLSGEAFRDAHRAGAPVECMYLPFEDSWPTPLTEETYDYHGHWPGRGEDVQFLVDHYLTAPYIGDALSQSYKDAFLAVQRQFIEHFRERGWDRTEMQCFYGGKNTHRIDYGSNMWWTTDEPYHWDDWLALQFFDRMWAAGRGDADPRQWAARADISRPQWQGRTLDGAVNCVYFGAGAFSTPDIIRRCQTLAREQGFRLRMYGSCNPDTESNTRTVLWALNAWLNGANGILPWQTLGGDEALDTNDAGAGGGNALLVPGERFGVPVVADMRLKALRDGQQLVEYLRILGERRGLQREQLQAMVRRALALEGGTRAGTGADSADALVFSTLETWQLAELRRGLAELIVQSPA